MNLEKLGWNSYFEAQSNQVKGTPWVPARVTEELKQSYRIHTGSEELMAEVSGRLRHRATCRTDYPAVGDWVLVDARPEEGSATIFSILTRRSKVSRKTAGEKTAEQILAANIDSIFVVTSLNRDLNLRRIERCLTLVWESGANPVVVLTKADLCDDWENSARQVESIAAGIAVHAISAVNGAGIDQLLPFLGMGQSVALLGSSGVGKSTLINRLLGQELLAVREVRASDDRGRHTTTSRQLIALPHGGVIIDTPGMRELQLWESEGGLGQTFDEIQALARDCRFGNCRHRTEPGCAIRAALEGDMIDRARFQNYQKLQKEQRYLALRHDALARSIEQKKWRKIHKAVSRNNKWS